MIFFLQFFVGFLVANDFFRQQNPLFLGSIGVGSNNKDVIQSFLLIFQTLKWHVNLSRMGKSGPLECARL